MRKPVIGLIGGLYKSGDGAPVYGLPAAYTKALADAGAIPLTIAPNIGLEALRALYERCDGVLIAGGGDVDPARYGMSDAGLVQGVDPYRDEAEIAFVRWAAEQDKPLLGICRGFQISNVALGGTLYRDIATEYPQHQGIEHNYWGKQPRSYLAHSVDLQPQSKLSQILGTDHVSVNSLHHQALQTIAPTLKVTASSAADGIPEAAEIPNARFFVGVQWHPEEMVEYSEPMRKLFAAFVGAAGHQE